MNTYHPKYDKPDAYLKAAETETDPEKKSYCNALRQPLPTWASI